jgi:hypothetical protein
MTKAWYFRAPRLVRPRTLLLAQVEHHSTDLFGYEGVVLEVTESGRVVAVTLF